MDSRRICISSYSASYITVGPGARMVLLNGASASNGELHRP